MDNNVISSNHGLNQIEKIINLKINIDFNQGLDHRIIAKNKDIAELLSKVKWIRFIRLACDNSKDIETIERAINYLNEFGIKNYKIFVYVLIDEIKDALKRIEYLKNKDVVPFAQPLITKDKMPNKVQKKLARYVNNKAIFKTIEWKDYKS